MSETSVLIAAVIAAALLGYMLARARGREGAVDQGRLTIESRPTTSTTKLSDVQSPSSVADAVESAVASLPEPEAPAPQPGIHFSIRTNVKLILKVPNQEVAEAVAERERAKGMTVVITPPDATDQNWRVTSTT